MVLMQIAYHLRFRDFLEHLVSFRRSILNALNTSVYISLLLPGAK